MPVIWDLSPFSKVLETTSSGADPALEKDGADAQMQICCTNISTLSQPEAALRAMGADAVVSSHSGGTQPCMKLLGCQDILTDPNPARTTWPLQRSRKVFHQPTNRDLFFLLLMTCLKSAHSL